MSGLSYLKGLRKSDLAEFAELTKLPDYDSMKKPELESSLDEHLKANQTTYGNNSALSDYYNRLAPRSPAKRGSTTGAGDDHPKKPRQRRPTQVAPETGVTSDSEATSGQTALTTTSKIKDLVKTPSRSISQRAVRLPPSPAVVTDTVERTTNQIKARLSHYYAQSGIAETHDSWREFLSRSLVIHWIPVFVELFALRASILPSKALGQIPSFPYIKNEEYTVYVPDLFLLLTQRFWAPFSLWAATSLVVPLTAAYFFNLALYSQSTTRSSSRRSSSPPAAQYDPIVYSITKALVSYLVYAQHWVPYGIYQNHTIATVNESVFGGYQGLITGAAVSGIVSLYDTILSK